MDQDRQIRFAIPPFILFASLLLGAQLSHVFSLIFKACSDTKEVIGLLAAVAVVVVPIGYLIGTISVTLLRVLARILGWQTCEAKISDSALDRIWAHLRCEPPMDKKLTLYAVATFDHELLKSGTHMWIVRRWNSFHVASHSIVALILAHLSAPIFSIPQSWRWWMFTVIAVILLFCAARSAWLETMKMIDFQSFRLQE